MEQASVRAGLEAYAIAHLQEHGVPAGAATAAAATVAAATAAAATAAALTPPLATPNVSLFSILAGVVAAPPVVPPAPVVPVVPPTVTAIGKAEVARWNAEPGIVRMKLLPSRKLEVQNPLSWWRDNETRFPCLARIARELLAIPATTAPCERLFSVAGLTIANDRASLTPELAGDLIFLHDSTTLVNAYYADQQDYQHA